MRYLHAAISSLSYSIKTECTLQVPLALPVFVMCAAVFLVVVPIALEPQLEFLWATLVMLAGLIFYVPFVHFKLTIPGMGRSLAL